MTVWARARSDVHGLALIGSWARDAGRVDSDIDFVILVADAQSFRATAHWVQEISWTPPIVTWIDASYGLLWSRHCTLEDGTSVELGFASREWASRSPIDPGTAQVLRDGCKVLYDPLSLLEPLCRQAAQQGAPADAAKRRA